MLQTSFPTPFVLRFVWSSKNIFNQILSYIFALDTLLFLAIKTASFYDITSQSYIKNKINAKLLRHSLYCERSQPEDYISDRTLTELES
jgi:hypothetical protein